MSSTKSPSRRARRYGLIPASLLPRIRPRSPSHAPRSRRSPRTSSACAAARRRTISSTLLPVTSLGEARAAIAALRGKAAARKERIPEPPEEPLPEECCQRGCERCVFIVYYEAVEAWASDIEQRWR
ncbi:MAG: hypothetical protein JO292_09255 [Betaproteobacteria bacterium]|nr:hypothetical protein [Betaproteobacteria bacterium]